MRQALRVTTGSLLFTLKFHCDEGQEGEDFRQEIEATQIAQ